MLRTDEYLRVLQDSMRDQRAILTDTEFEKLESRMGYHYWPNSVLNAESLQYKAMSTLMFDWPHVYVINGVAQYDIAAFMDLSRAITPQNQKAIITYEHLSEHVEHFTWPRRFNSCKKKRSAKGGWTQLRLSFCRWVPSFDTFL